jgi:restriction system protein
MEGKEFENYVAERLRQVGWTVEATSATGDFGVDLIAEKDGRRVAVQCKRLSHAVGVGPSNKSSLAVRTIIASEQPS